MHITGIYNIPGYYLGTLLVIYVQVSFFVIYESYDQLFVFDKFEINFLAWVQHLLI